MAFVGRVDGMEVLKQTNGDKGLIRAGLLSGKWDELAAMSAVELQNRFTQAAAQPPTQTVFESLLGPQQPQPQGGLPPPPPNMGGAVMQPPGAPPMPSQMASPPTQAQPRMLAGGGLASLPIPDHMFDDSYAGGGIVAFPSGGLVEGYTEEELIRAAGGDPANPNTKMAQAELERRRGVSHPLSPRQGMLDVQVPGGGLTSGGIPGGESETPMFRDVALGVSPMEQLQNFGRWAEEHNVENTYNRREAARGAEFVDPNNIELPGRQTNKITFGPNGEPVRDYDPAGIPKPPVNLPDLAGAGIEGTHTAAMGVPEPELGGTTLKDYMTDLGKFPERENAPDLSQMKKEDMWQMLAQIGFGMAGSKSPTLLGAVGEAGTAAMPGASEALKDRRAVEERERTADYSREVAKFGVRSEALSAVTGIGEAAADRQLQQTQNAIENRLSERRTEVQREVGLGQVNATMANANRETDLAAQARVYAAALAPGATAEDINLAAGYAKANGITEQEIQVMAIEAAQKDFRYVQANTEEKRAALIDEFYNRFTNVNPAGGDVDTTNPLLQ